MADTISKKSLLLFNKKISLL